MNKRLIYILGILALIFFITSLIIFLNSSSNAKKKPQSEIAETDKSGIEVPEKKVIKIFFLTEGSRFFRPKKFYLTIPENRGEIFRDFLDLMFSESSKRISPYPENLKLNSVFFVKNENMIVLDFSEDLLTDFPGGTMGEIEFIYFFVDNICYNFKEVEKVKFLIGGNEYKTISGHLDIQNPYYPNFNLIRDEQ